jgi:elongator complex protein 3
MSVEDIWLQDHTTAEKRTLARKILEDVRDGMTVKQAVRHHPLSQGGFVGKSTLIKIYRELTEAGEWQHDRKLMRRLRMKPVRTLSGVTTVTVLTKHYPCPGQCIFCPDDYRMPKSYLPDEPGAMRALHHEFDPYSQTVARIEALHAIGHPTDKIELLVLGGTWSSYQRDYQEWFLKRCFDAMNGFDSDTLVQAQKANETGERRNVGLVIETRPDHVDRREIARLRSYGVTKVQMGVQSLDDDILAMNKRGHSVQQSRDAVRMLRAAGFKIVLHWMPNLHGATLESDRVDFQRLWDDADMQPDEIKIYPCQLLDDTVLHSHWERGEYKPYSTEELIELLVDIKPTIPRYCRVNRIVRDIPSTNVVEGNKRTSLRQDVKRELEDSGLRCECVRCREVRGKNVDASELALQDLVYQTGASQEHFISYVTTDDDLAGYLRLSLPAKNSPPVGLDDLEGAAIIREVHVYGQSLEVGQSIDGTAQHSGLGTSLMEQAEGQAREAGYERLAVISAIGTREYYRKLGYELGDNYMLKRL